MSREALGTLVIGDEASSKRMIQVVRAIDNALQQHPEAIGVLSVLQAASATGDPGTLLGSSAGVVRVEDDGSASIADVVEALLAVIVPLPSMNHIRPYDLRELLRQDRPLRAAVVRGLADEVFAGVGAAVVEAARTPTPGAALCVIHVPEEESWQTAVSRLFGVMEQFGAGFSLLWCYEYHDELVYRITVIA